MSSIVFGMQHLSNHLPFSQKRITMINTKAAALAANDKKIIVMFGDKANLMTVHCMKACYLIYAMIQVVITTNIALQIFSPVYLTHGVGASIGAHMTYNLNALLLNVSVPGRLIRCLLLKVWSVAKNTRTANTSTMRDNGKNDDKGEGIKKHTNN